MFNFFKKKTKVVENKINNFEVELTASILAYEIARSDGDISKSELTLLHDEIKKLVLKLEKKKKGSWKSLKSIVRIASHSMNL